MTSESKMILVLEEIRRVLVIQMKKKALHKFRKIIKLYKKDVSQCRIWLIRKKHPTMQQPPSNLRNRIFICFQETEYFLKSTNMFSKIAF